MRRGVPCVAYEMRSHAASVKSGRLAPATFQAVGDIADHLVAAEQRQVEIGRYALHELGELRARRAGASTAAGR